MKDFIRRLIYAVRTLDYKMRNCEDFTECIYMTEDTAIHAALFNHNFTVSQNGDKYLMGYKVKIINSNMIIMGKDVEIYDRKD